MSVRLLTDASGAVVNRYNYDAFGTLRTSSGSTPNVYQYTGQQFDGATGLYSFRVRYYSPVSGRFLQKDPQWIQLDTPIELNRYIHAANDSINSYDPSGYELVELGYRFIEQAKQFKARYAMLKAFVGKNYLNYASKVEIVARPLLFSIFKNLAFN